MSVFLDKVDSAPLDDDNFSFSFNSWASVSTDVINENFQRLQNQINGNSDGLIVPPKTTAQIIQLAMTAQDSTMWYCTDHVPPVYVGKINGALVQFTTTPFP